MIYSSNNRYGINTISSLNYPSTPVGKNITTSGKDLTIFHQKVAIRNSINCVDAKTASIPTHSFLYHHCCPQYYSDEPLCTERFFTFPTIEGEFFIQSKSTHALSNQVASRHSMISANALINTGQAEILTACGIANCPPATRKDEIANPSKHHVTRYHEKRLLGNEEPTAFSRYSKYVAVPKRQNDSKSTSTAYIDIDSMSESIKRDIDTVPKLARYHHKNEIEIPPVETNGLYLLSVASNLVSEQQDRVNTCRCTRSRCIKLYCKCFQVGKKCSKYCCCKNCLNTDNERRTHKHFIENVRGERRAARDLYTRKRGSEGCSCKNSRCLKKYCECFNNKIPCSDRCTCEMCLNLGVSEMKRMKRS